MAEPAVACDAWRPDACEGTPACPPRCPRFVDGSGAPILVVPGDLPLDRPALGLEEPDPGLVGPDDLLLVATLEETTRGYALLRPGPAGTRSTRVAVAPGHEGGDLPVELARQAIAYAIADGAGRLVVETDPDPFRRAGPDLVETGDGSLAVPLTDPRATALTTPPGADAGTDRAARWTGTASDDEAAAWEGAVGPGAPDVPDLSRLFGPQVIAVVGATDREGAIGRILLENLAGYAGEVVPVTPRADTVFGRPAPDTIAEVPEVADVDRIDLALVALPTDAAVEAVGAAADAGVEHVVVVSSGFDEAGGEDHARRLREVAEGREVTLVGPNSMGVLSTATGLNATFSPRDPPRGPISVISQSGAVVTAAVAAASDRGLGVRHVVSVGNKADVDEVDLLRYYGADPGTDVVVAYLEDIVDGETFVEVARAVTRETPVVVCKAGRTAAGAAAAASHTGSLAGDDAAVDAALDRAGVLRADSIDELLDLAAVLRGPLPDGDAVGIVTNAGGPGVLATDAVGAEGLPLASFDAATRDRLADLLPPTASAANPVDVLGDADADRFAAAIDAVVRDPGVDVAVTVTTPHPLIDYADLVAAAGRCALARNTPVVTCLMDGHLSTPVIRALRQYGIPNYPNPGRAAAAVAGLRRYARARDQPPVAPPDLDPPIDVAAVEALVDEALVAGRDRLGVASLSLLEACGIPVPPWGLATDPEAAGEVASDIGGVDQSVVLKVASPDIDHKVDVGGVRTDVDPSHATPEATALLETVCEARPDARVDGVVVQASVDVASGVEVVAGATDSRFGPLLAVGRGGIDVEATADVAFELAPLDRRTADAMVDATALGPLLDGTRGREPADRPALVDALVRLAALADAVPAIAELDVNPLLVTPTGVLALDLLVALDRPA